MKKCLVLFVVALMLMAVPAMSARIATETISHCDAACPVFQAYWGTTPNLVFAGSCDGGTAIAPFAVPGVLSIVPGTNWSNFVTQGTPSYTIKNVRLIKTHGTYIQCPNVWNGRKDILQRGTENIRLWWPLMYEAPGTQWQLEVTYYVPVPAPAGKMITEIWCWKAAANLDSLKALITLFHELPYGICEVPLISDEVLFGELIAKVGDIQTAMSGTDPDYKAAFDAVSEFEDLVIENCINVCPPNAPPTSALGMTGVINTTENPACCKLLVDIESIAFEMGIFTPAK